MPQDLDFNLETAVVSTHLAQPIDSPSVSGENLITNKVTAISPDTPDKSIDYTMYTLPTAVSRFKESRPKYSDWSLIVELMFMDQKTFALRLSMKIVGNFSSN
jgi:hypothetical protein